MVGIAKDGDKASPQSPVVRGKHVAQPMERLHEAHGGAACPIQAAGCGVMKVDGQIAELDGPQPSVSEDLDTSGNCIGQSQVVGGGDAVNENAHFALSGQRIDHILRIGRGWLSGKAVDGGNVIKTAGDPAHVVSRDEAVQGKIDGAPGANVSEVVRRPDARLLRSANATQNGGLDAWRGSRHGFLVCKKIVAKFLQIELAIT